MMKMEIFSVEVDFWHGFCIQKMNLNLINYERN